jgi:O-antigen/teichoic acid export membrane protein
MPSSSATGSAVDAAPAARPSLRAVVLKNAAQFLTATLASQASGTIRSIAIGSLLGPGAAGVWIGLQLVVAYAANAHVGAIYGMSLRLPRLRGAGDVAAVEESKRTTFTFTLLTGLASFALVAIAASGALAPLSKLLNPRLREVLLHLQESEIRGVVLAVGALLPVNLLKAYYVSLFKAESRFREASIGSLIGAVVGVATIALIPAYGLGGVAWGLLLLVGAETAYLAVRAGRPRFGIDVRVLRGQIAIGLVTVGVVLLGTLLGSIDRTVLFERFAAEPRGHYYPALLAATFFAGLAAVPNSVLYPRIAERYGQTGSPASLVSLVERALRVASTGFAFLAGAAAIGTPVVLRFALPRFAAGATAAQIAIGGYTFYIAVGVAVNVLTALDRQSIYLVILGVSAGASYAITNLVVGRWPSLEAVAAGTSAGYLIFFVGIITLAWLLMEQSGRRTVVALLRALAPLAWSTAAAAAIIVVGRRLFPPASVVFAIIGEIAFAALMAPLLIAVARHERART